MSPINAWVIIFVLTDGYIFRPPATSLNKHKSTLDNSPPPNYDKESKDECHHVNNNPRYKWYVKPAAFQVIAPTRSNYGCKINVKNRNKSTILIFLPAIIELVQELLISNMHNKLEEDTCENVEVIAPTRSNYWRKMRKIAINRPFWIFFSAIIELVQELLISNMHNKFEEDMWKTFQVIAPTRSNYWRKMRKITINRPFFFFQPLLNLSKNYL